MIILILDIYTEQRCSHLKESTQSHILMCYSSIVKIYEEGITTTVMSFLYLTEYRNISFTEYFLLRW